VVKTALSGGGLRLKACWVLAALWAPLYLLPSTGLKSGPVLALGAFAPLLMIAILLLHGSIAYGWRGIGAYLAIGIAAGFALEASSVAFGFPFGFYVHNEPGPKPLGVPISAMLGYAVLGWYAWALGNILARERPWARGGVGRFTVPIVAAFVLAGFDYPFDPIGASVLGLWTYAHPSGQFGVPLTNYLGWIFTGWVIFQLFALVEARFAAAPAGASRGYWLLPCLIWTWTALQYPLLLAAAPGGTVARGGRTFVTADIYEAALAASLFSVVFAGLAALARLLGQWSVWAPREATPAGSEGLRG
jgi:putative membrane protein